MACGRVAVVIGSDSDFETMKSCMALLAELEIGHELFVMSAHRTPDDVRRFATGAKDAGFSVVIAAAGGAAHLAGVIAAETTLPVIGVPMASSPLGGEDALHSMVQMPPGVPVATVSVGAWGAVNSAVLAAQILALGDKPLAGRLAGYKRALAEKVRARGRDLKASLTKKPRRRA